jgi:hypothetical protein
MDESKNPPTHLGLCRYLDLYREVLDLSIIQLAMLYHEVPNLSIRFATVPSLYISLTDSW